MKQMTVEQAEKLEADGKTQTMKISETKNMERIMAEAYLKYNPQEDAYRVIRHMKDGRQIPTIITRD